MSIIVLPVALFSLAVLGAPAVSVDPDAVVPEAKLVQTNAQVSRSPFGSNFLCQSTINQSALYWPAHAELSTKPLMQQSTLVRSQSSTGPLIHQSALDGDLPVSIGPLIISHHWTAQLPVSTGPLIQQ